MAKTLLAMAKLEHMLLRQVAVGCGLATAMGHGGGTPVRSCIVRRPYRVLLASNVVVVVRWDHDGATVVAEERCGAS